MSDTDDLLLDAWRAFGKQYNHNGHNVFYREEGEGPVLLCIHGFPTASWDWHRIWGSLTSHYRVIAPDMLGFGFSDKPKQYDYTIADHTDLHEGGCPASPRIGLLEQFPIILSHAVALG